MTRKSARRLRAMLSTIAALFAMLVFAGPASALTDFSNAPQGAHYANGYGEPVCALDGLVVSCTGTQIVGVGNTDADLYLAVTTTFTGYCHNPGSKSKIVDPFTKSDTNTTSATLTPSKNGRLVVPAKSVTGTSSAEFAETFRCPNPNWEPEITGTSISYVYSLTFKGFDDPVIYITGP